MTGTAAKQEKDDHGGDGPERGPRYIVDIEGVEHEWNQETISVPELRSLGGLSPTEQVIEIDKDQNERTLDEGEVVTLKPGHGFSKKVRFKRGNDEWIAEELELLRGAYERVEHFPDGQWVRVGPARVNATAWAPGEVDVAFQIPPRGQAPYGLYVCPPLVRTDGTGIGSYETGTTPWGGEWGKFSWQPEQWVPSADLAKGANMLVFARSLSSRLAEGA